MLEGLLNSLTAIDQIIVGVLVICCFDKGEKQQMRRKSQFREMVTELARFYSEVILRYLYICSEYTAPSLPCLLE